MSAYLLSLALLLGSLAASAQEGAPQDMTLQASPPDAAPPMMAPPNELPVGVAQPPAPETTAEIERRNDLERREDESRRNSGGGAIGASSRTPKVEKLHIAKMERGPVIAPDAWKKGHWFHGKHDSSFAWWWVVDTTWFRYDKYEAPYPDHEKRQVYIPHSGSTSLSSVAPNHR